MKHLVARLIVCTATAVTWLDAHASASVAKLKEAKLLVDNSYGDRDALDRASIIVGEYLAEDTNSAEAYIQAARITIKGGRIAGLQFQLGTIDLYESLIGKALALEPNNYVALGLRAEVQFLKRDYAGALRTVRRALDIAPSEPWLLLTLAHCYVRTNDAASALQQYQVVAGMNSGAKDPDRRRAYVEAQLGVMDVLSVPQNLDLLRETASQIEAVAHPGDARANEYIADVFNTVGAFDDAISYGRKAVRINGQGKFQLSVALLGKAATEVKSGRSGDALAAEARTLGVDSQELLRWFRRADPDIGALEPLVARLLPQVQLNPPRGRSRSQGT